MKSTVARKLRQVPEGYLVIGVDPHKKKHAAVAITQDFTTRAKFKFNNTRQGLDMTLERARLEMVKTDCRGVIFAIETGGHYGAIWPTSWMSEVFRFISLTSLP